MAITYANAGGERLDVSATASAAACVTETDCPPTVRVIDLAVVLVLAFAKTVTEADEAPDTGLAVNQSAPPVTVHAALPAMVTFWLPPDEGKVRTAGVTVTPVGVGVGVGDGDVVELLLHPARMKAPTTMRAATNERVIVIGPPSEFIVEESTHPELGKKILTVSDAIIPQNMAFWQGFKGFCG